ncbi:purple acid phosphatase family protein, partial [Nocardioides salsibiostraticola]
SLTVPLTPGPYGFDVIARDAARNWSTKPWTPFTVTPPVRAERVVLTPTTTPETSQSVSWLGGEGATERLEIRRSGDPSPIEVTATARGTISGNPRQRFSTTATGLAPATAYDYRVGLPGSWSQWQSFRTADPNDDAFTFLYYGDAQSGLDSTWRDVVAAAAAQAPDAVGSVHAGDLINNADNDDQWRDWFAGMSRSAATSNVMAAPGNHEYLGDRLLTAWKSTFEYPLNQPNHASIGTLADLAIGSDQVARQYAAYFDHFEVLAAETVYYTDYQGVRFIALNPTRDQTFLRPVNLPDCVDAACPSKAPGDLWIRYQAAWLEGVLDQNPGTWDVVTFHQPVYSAAVGRNEPAVRRHLVPVFEEYDVDLVLMGHDHVYSRGYKDTSATGTPGLTVGPVYVVSNAGAKHYILETDPTKNVWDANGAIQVRTGQAVTTYQTIDVTDSTLHYRSWLVEKGPGASTTLTDGSVFDEFTITLRPSGQTWVTEPGVDPPN